MPLPSKAPPEEECTQGSVRGGAADTGTTPSSGDLPGYNEIGQQKWRKQHENEALVRYRSCRLPHRGGIAAVSAQEYPTRPIHVIVPLTPGSGADIAGRIVSKYMTAGLGQPVVVENRPGAGGQIGTMAVIKSPADGYTLMIQSASHAANSAIYKSLQYDPLKDLIDVAILGMTPYVMVTSPTGPYKTVKDLVDAAKAKPEKIPFASAGVGGATHLAAEYFNQTAGLKMLHIPYKGSPEAIRDASVGIVSYYMAPINTAIGLIKDGKIKALGVSSAKRDASLPDVPTIAEQGFPSFSIGLWFGMWAPAGTPQPIDQEAQRRGEPRPEAPRGQDAVRHARHRSRCRCRPRSSPSSCAMKSRRTSGSSKRATFRSSNAYRPAAPFRERRGRFISSPSPNAPLCPRSGLLLQLSQQQSLQVNLCSIRGNATEDDRPDHPARPGTGIFASQGTPVWQRPQGWVSTPKRERLYCSVTSWR